MNASPFSLAFALIAFGATLAVLTVGAATTRCDAGCGPEARHAAQPARLVVSNAS